MAAILKKKMPIPLCHMLLLHLLRCKDCKMYGLRKNVLKLIINAAFKVTGRHSD